jgi:hypothetical protein
MFGGEPRQSYFLGSSTRRASSRTGPGSGLWSRLLQCCNGVQHAAPAVALSPLRERALPQRPRASDRPDPHRIRRQEHYASILDETTDAMTLALNQ